MSVTTSKNEVIEEMAYLVCEMASKSKSCKECGGRSGGCFTIPKMKKLYEANYRRRSDVVDEFSERLKECYTDECITDDMTVAIGVIKQNIDDIATIIK